MPIRIAHVNAISSSKKWRKKDKKDGDRRRSATNNALKNFNFYYRSNTPKP